MLNEITNPRVSSQRLRGGVLRGTRLLLVGLVLASATLLGGVVLGAATGSWRLLPVRTGSMAPYAPRGSVVVVHPVPVSGLRRGQVIAFRAPVLGHPLLVHRIYQLKPSSRGTVVLTKGDANAGPDPWQFRIPGRTVWRGGLAIPELGNALFVLQLPQVRVAALATIVAILTAMALRAIWASGVLAPIVWRAPGVEWAPISWRAEPLPGWRARREQRRTALGEHGSRRRGTSARWRRRRKLIPSGVAAVVVALAATVGSGAFALLTGPVVATASYSTGVLLAPSPLSCQWTAASNVQLNWTNTSPTFATGYRYLRSNTSGSGYASIATTSGATSTTGNDTNPAPPTARYYVVESTHGIWTSPNSNQQVSTGCHGAINTIAGSGTSGYSGDGGPATSAALNQPNGVAVDASGNVYIADTTNAVIRKINQSGTITTFAGGGASSACSFSGAATSVQLNHPKGVAVDTSGNVYIADTTNNCVRKVSGGNISQVAGGGASSACSFAGAATSVLFNQPLGLAIDGSGNLYVSEQNGNCVRKVSGGNISQVAGGGASSACSFAGAATSVLLNKPAGLAIDSSGNLYIADMTNNCVRKVSGGNVSQVAGGGASSACSFSGAATSVLLNQPFGLAIDGSGNLYVSEQNGNCVRKVSGGNISQIGGSGSGGYSGDGGAAIAAALNKPTGLAVTSAGLLDIADMNNHVIRQVVL